MKGFWRKDWFTGLIIAVSFLTLSGSNLIQGLERTMYDFGVRASQLDPGDDIVVIAIDDASLNKLGRWPWPRDILAKMITNLSEGGAKVIGNTILLSEPQQAPEYISNIIDYLTEQGLTNGNETLSGLIDDARENMDRDGVLAQSIEQAGNVIMGMQFDLGAPIGKPDEDLPEFVQKNSLKNIAGQLSDGRPFPSLSATPPIDVIGEKAAGIGHLSFSIDTDGGIRTDILVVDYFDQYYPSIALQIAAHSLNLGPDDILIESGKSISLGNLYIKTDPISRMYPFFYQGENGQSNFSTVSFSDVYAGNIKPEVFKDKIVLIGATAYGVGTPFVTPISEAMHPVVVLANVVASILNQHFFIVPGWAGIAESLVFLFVALYLILALPRLSAAMAAVISVVLLVILIGSNQFFMIYQASWVQLMFPATLLVCGYLLLITKRFLVTEKGKIRADAASAQSNRTLGITLQQQGQLDMAFDKFQQCPLDDSMLDPLYNLSLDYESKRQFNKAQSVLEYMARFDANYRDVKEKIKRNKNLQDTMVFGAPGGGAVGTLMLDVDGIQKPMLGRYEIEKELGKGAMGTVYLGKDPKINRVVAIKTLALSLEFEDDELEEVKERFFREAETAGRLTHPNIVTIYDAGEEHDLAYIAMEFLKGHDLDRYTKQDKLLPIPTVLQMMILSADALNYAHGENVVHRDVKPANIMFHPETSKLKLTDFGIARITDSSKTKTGMVLGTPSYMSPEQIAGKHIDGRSDLFSLGTMLYQLLCGKLPYTGDSMTSLMFMIASDPPADITAIRPELTKRAPGIMSILDKVMQKSLDDRYQTGVELSTDLRKCLKMIKAQKAKKAATKQKS